MKLTLCLPLSAILLQGCVTAFDLDGDVRSIRSDLSVPMEELQCETKSDRDLTDALEVRLESNEAFAAFANLEMDVNEGPFEIGRRLVANANGETHGLSASASRYLSLALHNAVGIDIAAIASDPNAVTTTSRDDARRMLHKVTKALPVYSSQGHIKALELDSDLRSPLKIATITATDGWAAEAMTRLGQYYMSAQSTEKTDSDLKLQAKEVRLAAIVAAYYSAYFKNGEFLRVDLITSSSRDKLISELTEGMADEDLKAKITAKISEEFESLFDDICKTDDIEECVLLDVDGEQAFVTRAGKTMSFPGVSVSIDPNADKNFSLGRIDTDEIAGHLLQILIEAVGDAQYVVPGAPSSTLCRLYSESAKQLFCQTDDNAEKLSAVNTAADKAEASARAITSVVIRGGWLFSLNNEALADWIETLVGGVTRKQTEAAVWSRQANTCLSTASASAPAFTKLSVTVSNNDLLGAPRKADR